MKNTSRTLALSGLFALSLIGFTNTGHADEKKDGYKNERMNSDFKVKLGAGAIYKPDYEGSDDYETSALPVGEIVWKDNVTLSLTEGLKVDMFETKNAVVGARLGYWLGREEDDNEALSGLGDMDANAIAGLYGHYDFGKIRASAALDADIGGDREGVTFELATKYRTNLSDKISMNIGPSLTFASDDYMQAMYGIDSVQASSSARGYSAYEPEGGLKDVAFGIDVEYKITEAVSLFGLAEVQEILGDAADSPLVENEGDSTQVTAGLGLIYRF